MIAPVTAAVAIYVSSTDGVPVAQAAIEATLSTGVTVRVVSDRSGVARVAAAIVHVRVSAPGCATTQSDVTSPDIRVILRCSPSVIASVRVATGSNESEHRLPLAASVLDTAAIANAPALYGDELMRLLPGFDRDRSNSAFTNYGQLRVSFAGAGADRGLVLADGIPAQDGFGGQIDWTEYPVADIVRAELLRGPGSALYGAGAIGGVLQLETFAPAANPAASDTRLDLDAGSHGYSDAYVRATSSLGNRFSTSLSLDRSELAYNDLPPAYASQIDSAAQAHDAMASLKLQYRPSSAAVFDIGFRGARDYLWEGRPNYDFWRDLAQEQLGVQFPRAASLVSIDAYARSTDLTNRADMYPAMPGSLLYTQIVPTSERGVSSAWRVAIAGSTFDARFDLRAVEGESSQFGPTGAFESSGAGNQQAAGLALQETLRSRRSELVFGLRGDTVDVGNVTLANATTTTSAGNRTARAISPRIGARYDLSPAFALRIGAGGGFRAPFLNELVRGYQIGKVVYEPNANLVPERSASNTMGIDWASTRRHASLDYIETYLNDAIMFRTVDPTHQIRSNVDHAQTNGLTFAYGQSAGACTQLGASLTDQYARVTSGDPVIDGKLLQYVPALAGKLTLDTTSGSIETGVSLSYLGQTFADDMNSEPLGTAILAGAHVTIPLHTGIALVINADNVTGARYLSSVDRYGPPAIVSIGLRVPLARDRPSPHC